MLNLVQMEVKLINYLAIVKVTEIEEVPESNEDILLEIRGKLNEDGYLEAKEFTELDQTFDFELYKKVINMV